MTLSLLKTNLDAALLADGWDPESVTANCFEHRNWKCNLGHKWSTTVFSQVKNLGCPLCCGRKASLPVNYFDIENFEFLKKFVYQTYYSVTDTSQFPKDLDGLRVVVSFDEARKVKFPWILLTDKGKDLPQLFTSSADQVFPAYLFFPDSNILFLGLWVRATASKLSSSKVAEAVLKPLGISFLRISSFIQDTLLYGDSFVFQTYTPAIKGKKIKFSRNGLDLDDSAMKMELHKTLNIYSQVSVTSIRIKSLFPFLRDEEVLLVSIQILSHATNNNIALDELVARFQDLDVSKEALKYIYYYTPAQGECWHSSASCEGLKNARNIFKINLWETGLGGSRRRSCHWCQYLPPQSREPLLKFMAKTLQDSQILPPHQPTDDKRLISRVKCAQCGYVCNREENWCPLFGSTERCPIFR